MMTFPLDPKEPEDGPTEFSYGPGMFAPGVANGEGQSRSQDDFGENYPDMGLRRTGNTEEDNYARMVADRRTDPTDPESGRDFETAGNPDRFGPNPPLIRANPEPNKTEGDPFVPKKGVERKW